MNKQQLSTEAQQALARFKTQERAKNVARFGRWASTRRRDAADPMRLVFEQAPRNKLEAVQHGNALANTGNYPVGTSECFNVGIAGGCGPDCFVYLKGECGEPQEMLPGLDADGLKLHAELYGANQVVFFIDGEPDDTAADLRDYTHCAYCGERLGDYHQCAYTLAEDADAAAMRAYTLEQREHATNRGL